MKTWKKLLALLLALAMVFAFAACGGNDDDDDDDDNDKKGSSSVEETKPKETEPEVTEPEDPAEDLYGEWSMNWDFSEFMNELLGATLGEEVELPNDPVYIVMTMEFDTDTEFTMQLALDEDSFMTYMESLCNVMVDYMVEMVEAQGLTQADLEAQLGMSLDEYMASTLEGELGGLEESFEGTVIEGYFRYDGEKVYIAEDEDDLEDTKDYFVISLDGDELSVEEIGGDDIEETLEEMEEYGLVMPWKFERQ